ncbi:MAG: hypothetical protein WD186_01220 [Actinomycetota bacterium]
METVTWAIELGVGLACLAIGSVAIRGQRLRIVGVVLVVAGLAASGHALVQLVTG